MLGRRITHAPSFASALSNSVCYAQNCVSPKNYALCNPPAPYPRYYIIIIEFPNLGWIRLFRLPYAKQLTKEGRNYLGDWFDPTTLPVHPQANRLTTLWGKLKQK